MVSVVTAVCVTVEELLSGIEINARRAVIQAECDCEEDWLKSLEEGCKTQIVKQWLGCLTRPDTEDEVLNMYWLISVFPRKKG